MSDSDDRRAELERRLPILKAHAAALTEQLERQTDQLAEAQESAKQAHGEATSPDGLVSVVVDGTGAITQLQLAPTVFARSTTERLAGSIVETIARAKAQSQAQVSDAFAEVTQPPVVDLPEVFDGAPSLQQLFETANRPLAPMDGPDRSTAGNPPPQRRDSRDEPDDDDGFMMRRGSW
ncbi:YbaB/EbfC family nucleoid-associated protein [Actinoalloteichus hymeniacidonis]|uniref:YbaB/EbfC DNA-binding family protein n=1 Tax=Actinoalloteichus hymeniacidonis TaxID=340345 RepID=A0AAC9HSQ0_9PSEU|nr:YbaB/EbfC family nucleoid-associated protein [Actinoalloteichus hymeniacidonis]AOS64942.1 hypothetical protein TL08_20755 [Actinoalloteichus hymeniacidonis]